MDNLKFRIAPSSCSDIMTNPIGKGKAQIISELRQKIEDAKAKHSDLKDGLKSKETLRQKIEDLTAELQEAHNLPDVTPLSEGCKTYLKNWVISKYFGRKKQFTSKQTDKGNLVEADAIALVQKYFGTFLCKNEGDVVESDFIRGVCDVVADEYIIEIKSCYMHTTMPYFEKTANKEHQIQTQGYLSLYDKPKGFICYILLDMPAEILLDDVRRFSYRKPTDKDMFDFVLQFVYTNNGFNTAVSICTEFGFNIAQFADKFKVIEDRHRVVVFEVERDDVYIAQIEQRVNDCQGYVNQLVQILNSK